MKVSYSDKMKKFIITKQVRRYLSVPEINARIKTLEKKKKFLEKELNDVIKELDELKKVQAENVDKFVDKSEPAVVEGRLKK